ncbi:phospholipase D-like domain-containing protein [Trinickia sp. LjRoot230]|uniref:phospholipase D-like domain-containing protein n=1 Tax=Trinickia sp. LjRoot230 TaxID=3342288 RepID=UPI003ECD7602
MSRRGPSRLARFGAALVSRRHSMRLAFTAGNDVRLFSTGDDYFAALVAHIDAAQYEVALETYIYCDDAAGRPISEALMRAARRGVRVRVITDGMGTGWLPVFDEWRAAGVQHRIYNPHLFGRFGFSRTHRKIAFVDDRAAFCGGINIVDDYDANGLRLPFARWDFALEVRGPVLAQIRTAFDAQWRRIIAAHRLPTLSAWRASARVPPAPRSSDALARGGRGGQRGAPAARGEPAMAFIARDNLVNRRAIEKAYLVAIGRARHEILVANPYFMPGRKMRRALIRAARRGVVVHVLVGRKEFVALDHAVRYLHRALLTAGVHIAEYEKTMLHAKVAVVDAQWATVGSSNLDALSLVLNNEANIVLVEHPEIGLLRSAMLAACADGRPIDPARYAARRWPERLVNWLAYAAYRTLMKLLTSGGYD